MKYCGGERQAAACWPGLRERRRQPRCLRQLRRPRLKVTQMRSRGQPAAVGARGFGAARMLSAASSSSATNAT